MPRYVAPRTPRTPTSYIGSALRQGYDLAKFAARVSKHVKQSRKSSNKTQAPTATNRPRPRSAIMRTPTDGVRAPYVKKNPRLKTKQKPKVKVSKDFKNKVTKVLESKEVTGLFQTTQIERFNPQPFPNQNHVTLIPNGAAVATIRRGQLFGADRALHVASRCWNNKLANIAPDVLDAQNFGSSTDLDTLNNVSINITKQWWYFKIKNNCKRTVHLKLHQCRPKATKAQNSPIESWDKGMEFDLANGAIISNVTALQFNSLNTAPQMSSEFKSSFTVETIVLTLEPGQSHELSIKGPSMTYQMKKYFKSLTTSSTLDYTPIQKDDVFLIWETVCDLVIGNNGEAVTNIGYGENLDNTIEHLGDVVLVESQYHAVCLMPEQTGFDVSAVAGTTRTLDKRKPVRVVDNFTSLVEFGVIERTDEVEPSNELT